MQSKSDRAKAGNQSKIMDFFKPKAPPHPAAPPQPPSQHPLHQAIASIQTHFSSFFHGFQSSPPPKSAVFARTSDESNNPFRGNSNFAAKNRAMSAEAIEERLDGVPVYALGNGSREFVLVSGTNTEKALGLFCFSEADANTLLEKMKSIDPFMSSDSQVVPVALSKVIQLKVDGVALRLMPEASQINNALKEKKKAGNQEESFPGVPVFQSKSLVLRSQNKRYHPAFFRKEDLEKSLLRASRDQKQLNPSLREGDIQVAVLEDILRGMKDSSVSKWNDVVFVPPGFDVSTDLSRML